MDEELNVKKEENTQVAQTTTVNNEEAKKKAEASKKTDNALLVAIVIALIIVCGFPIILIFGIFGCSAFIHASLRANILPPDDVTDINEYKSIAYYTNDVVDYKANSALNAYKF